MSVDDEYHIAEAELYSTARAAGQSPGYRRPWGRPTAPRPTEAAAAAAVGRKTYTIFSCNFN